MKCRCGKDAGRVDGNPITTEREKFLTNGICGVRWEDGSPHLYGATCAECLVEAGEAFRDEATGKVFLKTGERECVEIGGEGKP